MKPRERKLDFFSNRRRERRDPADTTPATGDHMMSNKPVLAAFFVAAIGVAAGSAWAASENADNYAQQATSLRDFGKLSAAGASGFRDLRLARLAIFDGQTAKAKSYADGADQFFAKAKGDDTAFMKAENQLLTADQMAARKPGIQAGEVSPNAAASHEQVAWLPVDGAMNIDENYTTSPTKVKAVAEANKSLAMGDRMGAMDHLKLAGIDTSVVLEVVPRDQTISDVHQAAQLIDAGKYYEGSQMLRKVQVAARFDVTNILSTPKTSSLQAPTASAKPASNAGNPSGIAAAPKTN